MRLIQCHSTCLIFDISVIVTDIKQKLDLADQQLKEFLWIKKKWIYTDQNLVKLVHEVMTVDLDF